MFLLSFIAMDDRVNSKVHQHQLKHFGGQEQYPSSYFSYDRSFNFFSPTHHTHFNKHCPMISTMDYNELNNARVEADRDNSISFTPSEDSSIEAGGDALDDEEVRLNELLFEGKTKKKMEVLAAMVGAETSEPAIVLTEVVKVLKVLKAISQD